MVPDAPDAPAAWSRSRWALLVLAAVIIAAGAWAVAGGALPDATYAPLSTARQMRAGAGATLPTADALTPLYPIVPLSLSALHTLGLTADAAPIVLGAVASVVAAVCLVALGGTWWTALGVVIAAGLSGYAPDSVLLALALLGLLAADRGQWRVAGGLIGVACGAHPAAFLIAALAAITAQQAARLNHYAASLVVAVILLLSPALLTGRALLPLPLGWLLPAGLLLALIAFWRRSPVASSSPSRLLPAWMALTMLLFPIQWTLPRSTPDATAAGAWIAANTSPLATLATTRLGSLTYAANRPLTLGGNPLTTWDRAFFVQHAPAVVALPTGTLPAWADFATTYARTFSAGRIEVYQPVVIFTPLTARPVTHTFNGNMAFRRDLVLVSAALAEQVTPGQMVRVWLEWQLATAPSFDLALTLSLHPLDPAAAPLVTHTDVSPPSTWRVGTVRTYHLLPLPADLGMDAGEIALSVAVNVRGGSLGRHEIARTRLIR